MIDRFEITLPVADNDGMPVERAHVAIRAALLAQFGGYSERAGSGAWIDGGRTYSDRSRVYVVDVDCGGDCMDEELAIENIARQAARDARQVSVYVTRQPIERKFVS